MRKNKNLILGDTEKIITNCTSAGGALSALAGASGNCKDFEKYLEEIGAADERDDIFAASCYCPIHNLENADTAYEWQFCGENKYFRTKHKRVEDKIIRVPDEGDLTDEQIKISPQLKKIFTDYVNSLQLLDDEKNILTLDADGKGNFKNFVKKFVLASAKKEFETHNSEKNCADLMVKGSEISAQNYLQFDGEKIIDFDWDAYIKKITRMKQPPAFDALDLKSPENEEFGDEKVDARHFTKFSMSNNKISGAELADEKIISLMNPTSFIGKNISTITKNWRIRHGAFDRDTSLAIPTILATLLKNNNFNVDFALPWGLPYSGDYDLAELFAWIDNLV